MSTLQNFAVPVDGQKGMILQPKPRNRFRCITYSFGPTTGGIDFSQNVMTCSRPNASQTEQEVHSYNSVAYYGGKVTYAPIEITLRDDVTNKVAALVGYQLQKQMDHFEQVSTLAGSNYKFNMDIESLDGGEGVLDTWNCEGGWIVSANYGDYDYSSAEPATIQLSIRFDNITQAGGLMPTAFALTTSGSSL